MTPRAQSEDTLIDFITGRSIPNTGAENNRQAIERFLVDINGYERKEIEVDAEIKLDMEETCFKSTIDLVIRVNGARYMVIKCAAGSLSSREREVIAAARLLENYQIPLAVASDGETAIVWDTISGDPIGKGLHSIPSKYDAEMSFDPAAVIHLDEKRRHRQKLIYRTYATRSCAIGP